MQKYRQKTRQMAKMSQKISHSTVCMLAFSAVVLATIPSGRHPTIAFFKAIEPCCEKYIFEGLTDLHNKFTTSLHRGIHVFFNHESDQNSKPYQCNGSDGKSNLPCFNCHVLHATWFNCLEKSDDGMSSRWHGSKGYRAKCQHAHSAVGNFSWHFCHLTGFFVCIFASIGVGVLCTVMHSAHTGFVLRIFQQLLPFFVLFTKRSTKLRILDSEFWIFLVWSRIFLTQRTNQNQFI